MRTVGKLIIALACIGWAGRIWAANPSPLPHSAESRTMNRDCDETPAAENPAAETPPAATPAKLPNLPLAITSFGGASIGDTLYIYGGHHGRAHHYSKAGQSGDLLRLKLPAGEKWEVVSTGPRLQGLALVAHGGKLYRLGGFEARNEEGAEQDIWSVADFAVADPSDGKWKELPPLPEPRSSFDARVIGDVLYVVGGWQLRGKEESKWHDTAWAIDLSTEPLKWRELPAPGFQRRALALGSHAGKLLVVGGMQPSGKVTTESAIFDPAENKWAAGPKLPGEAMEGFGPACCELGGDLFVSTSSGQLLKLSKDEARWEPIKKLTTGRFFHQMLPSPAGQLLLLGGASMEEGRYSSVETASPKP